MGSKILGNCSLFIAQGMRFVKVFQTAVVSLTISYYSPLMGIITTIKRYFIWQNIESAKVAILLQQPQFSRTEYQIEMYYYIFSNRFFEHLPKSCSYCRHHSHKCEEQRQVHHYKEKWQIGTVVLTWATTSLDPIG